MATNCDKCGRLEPTIDHLQSCDGDAFRGFLYACGASAVLGTLAYVFWHIWKGVAR